MIATTIITSISVKPRCCFIWTHLCEYLRGLKQEKPVVVHPYPINGRFQSTSGGLLLQYCSRCSAAHAASRVSR